MKRSPISVGDIFEISLSDGRKAYGQYIGSDKYGTLIQIFNFIGGNTNEPNIDDITNAPLLFPPIYTGLYAAIKKKLWKVIGRKNLEYFVHPKFVSTLYNPPTWEATIWFLWDGENSISLGHELLQEYKNLEFLAIYSPYDIPRRIETGEKPYEKLINTNKYN